jgi:hypothetical protein
MPAKWADRSGRHLDPAIWGGFWGLFCQSVIPCIRPPDFAGVFVLLVRARCGDDRWTVGDIAGEYDDGTEVVWRSLCRDGLRIIGAFI